MKTPPCFPEITLTGLYVLNTSTSRIIVLSETPNSSDNARNVLLPRKAKICSNRSRRSTAFKNITSFANTLSPNPDKTCQGLKNNSKKNCQPIKTNNDFYSINFESRPNKNL